MGVAWGWQPACTWCGIWANLMTRLNAHPRRTVRLRLAPILTMAHHLLWRITYYGAYLLWRRRSTRAPTAPGLDSQARCSGPCNLQPCNPTHPTLQSHAPTPATHAPQAQQKKLSKLSGGERNRVQLAKVRAQVERQPLALALAPTPSPSPSPNPQP